MINLKLILIIYKYNFDNFLVWELSAQSKLVIGNLNWVGISHLDFHLNHLITNKRMHPFNERRVQAAER